MRIAGLVSFFAFVGLLVIRSGLHVHDVNVPFLDDQAIYALRDILEVLMWWFLIVYPSLDQ